MFVNRSVSPSVFLLPIAVVSLALAGVPASASDAWPRFLGAKQNSTAEDARNLPVSWEVAKNIAWRAEIPGEGWSSPVIADGRCG